MMGAAPEPLQQSFRTAAACPLPRGASSTVNLDPGATPAGTATSSKLANGRAVTTQSMHAESSIFTNQTVSLHTAHLAVLALATALPFLAKYATTSVLA